MPWPSPARQGAGFLLVLVLLVAVSCGEATADGGAFHAAVQTHRAGEEVTVEAILISEPTDVSRHEHLLVRATTGEEAEVDHNTALARRVPAHSGDTITIHGQLYLDPGRVGIHCTHARTSSGCPQPGWIKLRADTYS